MMHKFLANIGSIWLLVSFCFTTKADEIVFERDVAPILETRCWSCHGPDEREAGLRLDQRVSMLRGGDSGLAAVVPNEPDKSYLIEVVKHLDPDVKMPPDEERLPQHEIDVLEKWVRTGAVWPGQMDVLDEEKSTHWAFQPIKRPDLPIAEPVSGNDSTAHPIDAFLKSKLREQQLDYSEPTDARALLRRLSIVLTGLPPTAEEADTFVAAAEVDFAQAYKEKVEALLASLHFGERWGQHWLDVIRWAETNGSESNMYRKNAWVYRDYVIKAFNEDRPYAQFLTDQIAGDTTGYGEATGYLVAGPHVPIATIGQEPAAQRLARSDRMDEVLQTLGASALGMTIGCARCHNHKFDPISIKDYYAMSAVFQDVEFGSRLPELMNDDPRKVHDQAIQEKIDLLRKKLSKFGPWEEDWRGYKELHFQPTVANRVRITFDSNRVRLDELEIFSEDSPAQNVAASSKGTQVATAPDMTVVRTSLANINDGEFGTQAWGGNAIQEDDRPWLEFKLPTATKIASVRLSSDREDFFDTDYLKVSKSYNFAGYQIEVQGTNDSWIPVAATRDFKDVDRKNPERIKWLDQLHELIDQRVNTGIQPSFVGRFVDPPKTFVLMRGDPENPRDEVQAAGLSELGGELELKADAPGPDRRAAFARWLTDTANPLVSRVAVNRIWHHVFGQGIVATPSDFGSAGAAPSHPELLEWLAAEFLNPTWPSAEERSAPKPWSMKHMIRLMVMSQAFQQSSLPRQAGLAVDAGSSLLWRYPPKRVEAEVIRDAVLQASGSLVLAVGGQSYRIHNVKDRYAQWEVTDNAGSETWRRMIYQERMRRVDDRLFTAFDFPDCGQVMAKRPVSTTPLQALNLMNSDFVLDQSQRIAQRAMRDVANDSERIAERCFELLLGRKPSESERAACDQLKSIEDFSLLCRAIINTNEFAFLP